MKWIRSAVVSISLLVCSNAYAVTLGFVPPNQAGSVGDILNWDLVASDLAGEVISAYDFNIAYNDSVLSAVATTQFGTSLGNPAIPEAIYNANFSPGLVQLQGQSLLTDTALLALQGGDSVLLAEVSFRLLADGISLLEVIPVTVRGAGAALLNVAVSAGSARVGALPAVPEPASLALLGIGLAGLGFARRKRTR